jgi:hypothetical protein
VLHNRKSQLLLSTAEPQALKEQLLIRLTAGSTKSLDVAVALMFYLEQQGAAPINAKNFSRPCLEQIRLRSSRCARAGSVNMQ